MKLIIKLIMNLLMKLIIKELKVKKIFGKIFVFKVNV